MRAKQNSTIARNLAPGMFSFFFKNKIPEIAKNSNIVIEKMIYIKGAKSIILS